MYCVVPNKYDRIEGMEGAQSGDIYQLNFEEFSVELNGIMVNQPYQR